MSLLDGGWTVIQRRVDNEIDFNRNRVDYNIGFGKFNSSFWLGLKKIKRITDSQTYELYIGMESFLTGTSHLAHARYDSFSLGTDANDYSLSIGTYDTTSTAGDAFADHNGQKFSTPDEDNDSSMSSHCASIYSSGWWYKSCHDSHLNGIYYLDGVHPTSTKDGIIWDTWIGDSNTMKNVVMAIRPT